MKRMIGSRNIHATPHDELRTGRRVSGTVRVSTSAAHPHDAPTDHDMSSVVVERPDRSAEEREPAPTNSPLRAQTGTQKVPSSLETLLSRLRTVTSADIHVSAAASWAVAISVLSFAAHFLLPSGAAQLVVPWMPLALLFVARHDNRRMQWAVYAGWLWFALAWVELVHATAAPHATIYRLSELTALGVILVQLFEAARFMQHLSQRDPLTGLLNRRGFEEMGAGELQRAARYDRPIAFALLDVDRFKSVNDQYGHAVGDRVLRIVSEELSKLRTSDLAVRLGGDEFGLLMPETDSAGAEQLVSRLQQRIHMRMFEQGLPVTISAGVASSDNSRRRLPDLIAEADTRMYRCKKAERA